MLRTTLSKLKKACSSLSLAPRVLRGDTRYTPGKFQKFSITALRRAEKSTDSGKDKDAEYEKCKNLIELIFGSSKPLESVQGVQKPKFPDDPHNVNEAHKEKLPETIVPQVHETIDPQTDRLYSEACGKGEGDKRKILETKDVQLHATTAKQTEEQLAQKIDIIKETPMVEAERPAIDGFNAAPRVLGNLVDAHSFQNFDSRKFDDFEDIRIHRTPVINETETYEDNNNINETVESIVRRIEEARRLEDIREVEEVRRIEHLLSNEIERSDFKLPIYNFASNRRSGTPETPYDELAKRCLDAPSSKIDERLLKEMEKLGVPQTSSRGESSVIEENIIQIDMKKPRKPVKKTEYDLETREFERDPPIAYVDKLHPAFQMANSPKSISEDDNDSDPLTTERIQLYELDKKRLEYSEQTAIHEPEEANTYEDNTNNIEPSQIYDHSQAIIDPYDKRTIAFENEGEEYDPFWYEKFSPRQEELAENITTETIEGVAETAEVKSVEANEAINYSNQSEARPIDQSNEDPEPYIAHESQPLNHTSEKWQFSEQPEPFSNRARQTLQAFFQHETPKTNPTEHENEFSTKVDPIESVKASDDATQQPSEINQYNCQYEPTDTTKSNTPKTTTNTNTPNQPPSITRESNQFITPPEAHTSKDYNTFEYDTPEPTIYTDPNTEKKPVEGFQYSTPPEPTESPGEKPTADVTYMEPKAEEKPNAEQHNTNITPEQKSHCMEPKAEEKPNTEPHNPNITPEQISHSFVQPQTMVNPLVDSRTLAEPADEIQKTMSAACGPLPKIKPDEEVSLSEMLKRVRMRNKMQCCQAYDTQVDTVTGKCGKKTPPCPPPAPKCPQCPPPPCPPPPPPCPKPCKPACPPPCPPPCPAKKNPCQKFKKHFPGIDFKSIISLLLQPGSNIQKHASTPNLFLGSFEPSCVVLAQEATTKLQNVGLNLLVAYPRKNPVSSSSYSAENLTLARDYDPWVPIPSWPIPKQEKKRPFVCPKEGCKLLPPPKLRPACNENPCINFPKRTNSFSITNLFSFSLVDYIVFDIID